MHVCVCVCWSCLKESSSDGAWKPCSAAVLPVHRQLHCWALNTRSAWTAQSFLFLSSIIHPLCSLRVLNLNPPNTYLYIVLLRLVADSSLVPILSTRKGLPDRMLFFPQKGEMLDPEGDRWLSDKRTNVMSWWMWSDKTDGTLKHFMKVDDVCKTLWMCVLFTC